jgi:hypothetical protein
MSGVLTGRFAIRLRHARRGVTARNVNVRMWVCIWSWSSAIRSAISEDGPSPARLVVAVVVSRSCASSRSYSARREPFVHSVTVVSAGSVSSMMDSMSHAGVG